MTTKHTNVKREKPETPESAPDALRTAYEIHTLAQMVYGRLVPQAYTPAIVPGLFH